MQHSAFHSPRLRIVDLLLLHDLYGIVRQLLVVGVIPGSELAQQPHAMLAIFTALVATSDVLANIAFLRT